VLGRWRSPDRAPGGWGIRWLSGRVTAVALADVSGMSKAEVEHLLPFTLGSSGRRRDPGVSRRAWFAATVVRPALGSWLPAVVSRAVTGGAVCRPVVDEPSAAA
jgi:hypothetical protein